MARPLKPLARGGGYYPSRKWTPLVYPGGYTTANGGEQPEPEAVLKTVTGSLIHITDALALPAEALSVNVEPIQAGSGDPSPDNVRPISGRTSATIYRSGADTSNPTTYAITLGDTVYGGTLDVTGGKMVVDRAMVDMGTLTWYSAIISPALGTRFYTVPVQLPKVPTNIAEKVGVVCSMFTEKYPNQYNQAVNGITIYTNSTIQVYDSTMAQMTKEEFKAAMSGVQLCYELAQPIEITLTPTQIEMSLGENNLWADAGDSTLTYYAEGEASTSEALGILLGGTYNNPGGADDASDDEALGILLGGT